MTKGLLSKTFCIFLKRKIYDLVIKTFSTYCDCCKHAIATNLRWLHLKVFGKECSFLKIYWLFQAALYRSIGLKTISNMSRKISKNVTFATDGTQIQKFEYIGHRLYLAMNTPSESFPKSSKCQTVLSHPSISGVVNLLATLALINTNFCIHEPVGLNLPTTKWLNAHRMNIKL